MTYYACLSFQNARIARGFFPQPGGVCSRSFGAIFFQIRQAHHIPGNAHQIVAADVGGKFTHAGLERAQTKLHQRLRIPLDGFVQRQDVADPGMVVRMMGGDGLQVGNGIGFIAVR